MSTNLSTTVGSSDYTHTPTNTFNLHGAILNPSTTVQSYLYPFVSWHTLWKYLSFVVEVGLVRLLVPLEEWLMELS